MKPIYTIKLLSNKSFDRLPYRGAYDSLGLADPKMNTAYVRFTAYPELNRYLIDHEFEHLIEKIPTDEMDGIRYKKFRQVVGNIAPYLGSAVGAAFGGPPGAALGGALGGGLQGGIGGQQRSFGGALQGAGLGAGAGYLGAKLPGFLGGGGGGGPLDFLGNLFGSPAQTGVRKGFTSAAGTFRGLLPGTSPSQIVSNPRDSGGGALGGFFSPLLRNKTALGGGLLGLGLLRPLPKVPGLPASVEELRSRVRGGGSPLNQFASAQLMESLRNPFQIPPEQLEPVLHPLRLKQAQELEDFNARFRSQYPGNSPETSSEWKRLLDELNYRQGQELTEATTRATQGLSQQRLLPIQLASQFNEQELAQLSSLAQLDVDQLMIQHGMSKDQAINFKNTFQQLGSDILLNSLFPYQGE